MVDYALVMPTIRVPESTLRAYRDGNPDALILIVGSPRSPHAELQALATRLGNARYLTPYDTDLPPYRSTRHYQQNAIAHRNVGVLEALRLGADVILNVDDDNAPRDPAAYWADAARILAPARDRCVATASGWWNVGSRAHERYRARGLPPAHWGALTPTLGPPPDRPLGVIQGDIYGDPDLSAVERLCCAPQVSCYAPPVVVDPRDTYGTINSQNTVWRRETAPLAALWLAQDVGRHDDIWAGYFAQRVLAACGYLVGYGPPTAVQTRNAHDLCDDLAAELHGYRYTAAFGEFLRAVELPEGQSVLATAGVLTEACRAMPPAWRVSVGFLRDWLADVASVLQVEVAA